MREVGILCNEDHEVFSQVSDILEGKNSVRTEFIDPGQEMSAAQISRYDLLVPKKSRAEVYTNLYTADQAGVETLNSLQTSVTADNNLASIWHLGENGFNVPSTVRNGNLPDIELIEKPLMECYRTEPRKLNGEGTRGDSYFLEEFLPSDGMDYKVYIVDCETPWVSGVKTPSKLTESDGVREPFDPEEIGFGENEAEEVLSTFYDADFIGLDIIQSDDEMYIVDVNSAPSFRGVEEAPEKLAAAAYDRLRL